MPYPELSSPSEIATGHDLSTQLLPSQDERSTDVPLSYYWHSIWKYRNSIIALVLFTTIAVAIILLAQPKMYEGTVILQVDPQSARQAMGSEAATNSVVEPSMIVSTEAQVLQSPAVLLQVVKDLHLAENPEFKKALNLTGPGVTTAQTNLLLREMQKRTQVDQPLGTLLLDLHFRAHDPQLAANIANGIAQAFIDHEYSTRARALHDSSRYMSAQLDSVRAQMEQAQSALVQYESDHDVIDPEDKTNIYNARLAQINSDYSAAQLARVQLEAQYRIVQTGTLDDLLVTPSGKALSPLKDRVLADQRTLSRMAQIYGQKHPLYEQQVLLLQHDRDILAAQQRHIAQQIRSEYRAATLKESLIQNLLQQQKTAIDDFNKRAIRYQALKAAADSSSKLYYQLQQRIQDATVSAGLHAEDLRITSPARPSDRPVAPRPALYSLLAFLMSSLVGIGYALFRTLSDRSLSTPEQIEFRFGMPAIGTIPEVESLAVASLTSRSSAAVPASLSAFDEAILSLHTSLQFGVASGIRVLALTSAAPGEGKSTITAHLARAFAAMGTPTILVDADMRKPNVHRLFEISNRDGLSSILAGRCSIEDALVPIAPNLQIIPAGSVPQNPLELLRNSMSLLLQDLRDRASIVLVDCPPVVGFADTQLISTLCEGVLLVVLAAKTEQPQISAALRALRAVRSHPLGIILNRVSRKVDPYYGYYTSTEYYQRDKD